MHRLLTLLVVAALLLFAGAAGRTEPYVIHVDVDQKQLTVWQGDEMVKRYTVATGASDTPTPLGTFTINSRFSGKMCGFGTCFLGLSVPWGQYGIHGTNKPESIGTNASHGCIRMHVEDAEELYALVPNGTKVVIQCGPYGELGWGLGVIQDGDRSSAVRALQRKLRALGYYTGSADGIYGASTQAAVRRVRKAFGLPEGNQADWAVYQAIGLVCFE